MPDQLFASKGRDGHCQGQGQKWGGSRRDDGDFEHVKGLVRGPVLPQPPPPGFAN